MDKKTAYAHGKQAGLDTAYYGEFDPDLDCDERLSEALEGEVNARQFSPFEFLAQELNSGRDPEALWEAYERGVEAGAKAGLKKRFRCR
jgi:hypothetical protein